MEHKSEKKRLTPRTILIIVLALVVLGEGAFLLLHRKADPAGGSEASGAGQTQTADSGDAQDGANADPDGSGDAQGSASGGSETSDAPTASPSASPAGGSAAGGTQSPTETPAVVIPKENKGKPYAGAIGILTNYAKSPSLGTLSYLLGGELVGDEMSRFLPPLMTMSGSSADLLLTETKTSLGLPNGTTTLTVTGETALSQNDLTAANEKLGQLQQSFSAIGTSFSSYASFTDTDWADIGKQLSLSGPDAKRMVTELANSATAISNALTGATVSEGYAVTMKTNTGEAVTTNVYCINGKWVTSAFFDMQFV